LKPFDAYNPIVISIYFLSCLSILMFSFHPVLLLEAFVGAVSYFQIKKGKGRKKNHLFSLLLFLVLTLINPLFSHNGKTVLFVINDAPITLEAFFYGAVSGGTAVTALYLFRSFSEIMTRDKLLYVFGKLSPKLSLILSMGLRYVPLFQNQARKISESQRALGLYREDNVFDRIRGGLRVFSVLITWALENGITTADSIAARGYGSHKRTYYSLFRFEAADGFFLGITLFLTAFPLCGMAFGFLQFTFYPEILFPALQPLTALSYAAFLLLSLLPTLNETEELIRWNYLQSKI